MYRISPEDDGAEPFPTPVEVEQRHLELVEASRALDARARAVLEPAGEAAAPAPPVDLADAMAALRAEVTAFERRLSATGVRIPEGDRRSVAQSILDFWALRKIDLAGLAARLAPEEQPGPHHALPEAVALAPYDPRTAIDATARAEACYAALPADGAQERARQGFLAILEKRAPLPAEAEALDWFVAAGVLCRAAPGPSDTGFMLVHEALPQAWDRLAQWQGEAAKVASELERVRMSAQAWDTSKDTAELPRGPAVKVVEELAKQDPTLKDFAEAAKSQRQNEQRFSWLIYTVLGGLFVYALAVTIYNMPGMPWSKAPEAAPDSAVAGPPSPAPTAAADVAAEAEKGLREEGITSGDSASADTAAGSRGWIWLGSPDIPTISLADGTNADLTTLARGAEISPRFPIKIRADKPADGITNEAGERIGQVSAGVTVELLDKPVPVTVKGVDQYWAQVRAIPVVFIQAPKGARVPLGGLTAAMADAGYTVKAVQQLPRIVRSDNGLSFDVRYYYEQDEQAARDVAAMVLRSLGKARARPGDALLPLVGSPLAERVQTGTIEVWFYLK